MRDRLIDLLWHSGREYDEYCEDSHEVGLSPMVSFEDMAADHLLAAGVIVPPCKVGDTVYYLTSVDTEKELGVADIFCGTVQSVAFDGKNIRIAAKYTNGLYYHHKERDFWRDVFLTPEQAEKALAKRREKDATT